MGIDVSLFTMLDYYYTTLPPGECRAAKGGAMVIPRISDLY